MNGLSIEISLYLKTCELYQDNLSASKVTKQSMKTKQLKNQPSKINSTQQYHTHKIRDASNTYRGDR